MTKQDDLVEKDFLGKPVKIKYIAKRYYEAYFRVKNYSKILNGFDNKVFLDFGAGSCGGVHNFV